MRELFEFRVFENHARNLFSASVGKPLGSGIARQVKVFGDSPLLKVIGEAQKKLAADGGSLFGGWSVRRSYTRQEFNSASFFLLTVTAVFEPAGEESGTVYDESTACLQCGSGGTQVGPLYLPQVRIPKGKDICKTIAGEVIASERTRRVFEKNKLVGAEFLPIYSKPGSKEPYNGWFQLRCVHSGARVVSPTKFGVNPFDLDELGVHRCRRGDLMGLNVLSEVTFDLESSKQIDLTCSSNYVGIREGLLRPERMMIASQRLRRVIEAENLKGIRFEVAHLSDSERP
jgi:hypothetical protein